MTYNKHLLCAVRMLRFCKWFHQRLPVVSIWFLVFRDETLGQINWAMRKWELGFWWLGHSIMEISLWVKSSFIHSGQLSHQNAMFCFVFFLSPKMIILMLDLFILKCLSLMIWVKDLAWKKNLAKPWIAFVSIGVSLANIWKLKLGSFWKV